MLKVNASGNVTWQKVFDSAGVAVANSVQQTADGGYIVAGYRTPLFDLIGSDVWVLKLDANGNVLWQKTYGGSGDDHANSLYQTPDGGIVGGYTSLSAPGAGMLGY